MIAFEDQLGEKIKEAMKSKNQIRLDTLRAMKSALKYRFVEKKQSPVTEAEAIQVFQSLIKQRKEAQEQFEKNGRSELAAKEKQEMEIIAEFLPTPLSEADVKALVNEVVQKLGASSMKDMGAVMKEVSARAAGRAEGKLLSELVKSRLSP